MKPPTAPSVLDVPDSRRSNDSQTETTTYWDSDGRFSFEYPAAWRIIEGQDQVFLSSSEANECTVELDFHSWGSVIDPRGFGFEDSAKGACQVYMKDAITNGRPTDGPENIQVAGADDAAWVAYEWNFAVTEVVVFRVGGMFKKLNLHYAGTASQLRSDALIPLQTLRINNRHGQLTEKSAQIGNSPPPAEAPPQIGAAEEGYVAPSQASSFEPSAAATVDSKGIANSQSSASTPSAAKIAALESYSVS